MWCYLKSKLTTDISRCVLLVGRGLTGAASLVASSVNSSPTKNTRTHTSIVLPKAPGHSRAHLNFKSAACLAPPYTSTTLFFIIDSFPYTFPFLCNSHRSIVRPRSEHSFILHLSKSVVSWISSKLSLEWLSLAIFLSLLATTWKISLLFSVGVSLQCFIFGDSFVCFGAAGIVSFTVSWAFRARVPSGEQSRSTLSACFLSPCARLTPTGCVIFLRGWWYCLFFTYNILVCTRYRSDFCNRKKITVMIYSKNLMN